MTVKDWYDLHEATDAVMMAIHKIRKLAQSRKSIYDGIAVELMVGVTDLKNIAVKLRKETIGVKLSDCSDYVDPDFEVEIKEPFKNK